MATNRVVLLIGHGTIAGLSDMPEFLRRIRRGRPPSAGLVTEIQRRYAHIGGSPLLFVTESLARAMEERLGLPVHVAMRFWDPLIEDVVTRLMSEGVRELCVLPVAPFSVNLYRDAVKEVLAERGDAAPSVVSVAAYGSHPSLIAAHADAILPFIASAKIEETELVLTAHSLPKSVLSSGDPYQREFEASARAISERAGFPATIAYQSQGADGGDWLGPTLLQALTDAKDAGKRRVVVSPVGFLADHVETLYDLDIEAAAQAHALGLEFARVPALGDSAPLVETLSLVAEEALR